MHDAHGVGSREYISPFFFLFQFYTQSYSTDYVIEHPSQRSTRKPKGEGGETKNVLIQALVRNTKYKEEEEKEGEEGEGEEVGMVEKKRGGGGDEGEVIVHASLFFYFS